MAVVGVEGLGCLELVLMACCSAERLLSFLFLFFFFFLGRFWDVGIEKGLEGRRLVGTQWTK